MMINQPITFSLPVPWSGESFSTESFGIVNFLVGPNGSGKSQFATVLYQSLRGLEGSARLLGTDRLTAMSGFRDVSWYAGNPFSDGFDRNRFDNMRQSGAGGSAIDTFVLLEEQLDLRIQVEATLSQLFDREIMLEWDSGRLVPKAQHISIGGEYRLDQEECHGIKEIMVLLTNLYDDSHRYLVIDEPELNLHPQYQAFFMQEVRKKAGNPFEDPTKKVFFLVTHSPFIVDLRSLEDIKSVFCFDQRLSIPKRVTTLSIGDDQARMFTRRLSAEHKQLFFADEPIFVEGHRDAEIVAALMKSLGRSIASAGSCVIDSGGKGEATLYLRMCDDLDKHGHFIYDLDSLFDGNLRTRIREDESIQEFLVNEGLGTSFEAYFSDLQTALRGVFETMLETSPPMELQALQEFLTMLGPKEDWDSSKWAKARTATLTAIGLYREDVASVVGEQTVQDIEGRMDQIVKALSRRRIYVLPKGSLEVYLSTFEGDPFMPTEEAKRNAVETELQILSQPVSESDLSDRYGDLYEIVSKLPSHPEVDLERVLKVHVSDFIHTLQQAATTNREWQEDQIQRFLQRRHPQFTNVIDLGHFSRLNENRFEATIRIASMLGQGTRIVEVDEGTSGSTLGFELTPSDSQQAIA